jgi:hypothetical protein
MIKNNLKIYKVKYVINNVEDEMVLMGSSDGDIKNQITTFFKIIGNKLDRSKIEIEEIDDNLLKSSKENL